MLLFLAGFAACAGVVLATLAGLAYACRNDPTGERPDIRAGFNRAFSSAPATHGIRPLRYRLPRLGLWRGRGNTLPR